jgi:hypothetical protein
MSQLPAPERDPVNVMSLQAPKDLKGRLLCLIFNKHNLSHTFHVEVRFRQPAVRFRKPVAQIVPLARVLETAVETYLNSFKKSKKITEDTQDIGLYFTY